MVKRGETAQCRICSRAAGLFLRCTDGAVFQCDGCQVIFLLTAMDKPGIFSLYEDQFYDKEAERFNAPMELLVNFFRYLRARMVMKAVKGTDSKDGKRKVLDVGFSRGMMLSFLKRRGWECYGINVSKNVVEHGKAIGLHVRQGELPKAGFPKGFFDVITFWHVLEHVMEPHKYLEESARILRKGGKLIIEIPNIDSIPAKLFRCSWLALDIPRHLYHFTPTTLTSLLEQYGFHVDHITFFSLEHSIFSTLQSMLNIVFGKKNVLLESLKDRHTPGAGRVGQWLLQTVNAVLSIILLPFAVVLAILFAAVRQGDIMRLYCTKM